MLHRRSTLLTALLSALAGWALSLGDSRAARSGGGTLGRRALGPVRESGPSGAPGQPEEGAS